MRFELSNIDACAKLLIFLILLFVILHHGGKQPLKLVYVQFIARCGESTYLNCLCLS